MNGQVDAASAGSRYRSGIATGGPAALRLLLFIPCYNCAAQIGRVIAQLGGVVGPRIAEVLVLDNISDDDTLTRARQAATESAHPAITIARNHANVHLGGSHKAAFAYAQAGGFSHVIVLHGDDQGRLDDLAPVLDRGDHLRYDACLGARFMRGATLEGYSPVRRFGNIVFNALFGVVTRQAVRDLGSGLNIFGRAVFADPAVRRASDDLRFNVYLLLGAIDRRLDLRYFPISWREADQVSNVRLVSQARRTLAIAWDYAVHRDRFRTADHRDEPGAVYTFDIVARSGRGG